MIQLSTRIDKLSDETKMGAQKKAISERKLIYKSCVTNKQERMNSNSTIKITYQYGTKVNLGH